ncbi:VOC family protein [Actinopolymorpha rutila]|uniref:Putative 3-demethylubiquinone-9 3-methyltransferase (Glyoxalase superfamily) n=1 Tax=Actinopolymorpha rutila TaxID=446787 RepID=A0A852Z4D7_9ACTN|nr:putative 3-demethylubiquinone-9 3-methyltransferase (glyoxalase superfamily) [Actinopolymorpha rutila]
MVPDKLTTCLWFDGQAEAAANYYVSIFKNASLGSIDHYSEAGPGEAGSVITAEFELNGQQFVALNGGPQFRFTEAISFQIPCADQDEVDYYWNRLSEGGEEGPCGWLKDRFGVSWQVVPTMLPKLLTDPDPERSRRAYEAMYTMHKIDIAAMEKAVAGG